MFPYKELNISTHFSPIISIEYFNELFIAQLAHCFLFSRSFIIVSTIWTYAFMSNGETRNPFTPSSIISEAEEKELNKTGTTPKLIASSKVIGIPSNEDVIQKIEEST